MIFDEPAQQSMVTKDLYNFLKSLADFKKEFQVIIGITTKDAETMESINKLNKEDYKFILFDGRTILPI